MTEYRIALIDHIVPNIYDGIILAVSHSSFKEMGVTKIRTFGKPAHVLYDLKYLFPESETDLRL